MRTYMILALASALGASATAQQALQLDNVAASPFGYVRVADHPQLEPAQLTLEAWITPPGAGVGGTTDAFGAVIAGKAREATSGVFLMPFGLAWSSGTSQVGASVRTGANQGAVTFSDRTVPIGATAHVAMTYDGTLLRLFVDGILTSCASTGGLPIDYGPEDLLIGAGNFNSGFLRRFDGRIDEVRLWNRARTLVEIFADAGSPVSGSEPGLVACWNFDAGDFSDVTGNGHAGAAQGTQWSFVPEPTPTVPGGSLLGSTYCSPAVNNSTGTPGTIAAIGSAVVAENNLVLMATSLPAAQFGYFLTSRTQGMLSPPASSGTVCLAGDIGRFNQPASVGQGRCISVRLDLSTFPVNPPQAPLAGESWNFQCWYRDGPTNNFTDAITVTFL